MKARPIIFTGESVRAIRAGKKTQTRRVIGSQPSDVGFGRHCIVAPYCTGTPWPLAYYERRAGGCWNSSEPLKCPYGAAGNLLWVKETFAMDSLNALAGVKSLRFKEEEDASEWATMPIIKWRPAIFMPRWASRLDIEITAIRAQRLQEITEADAEAEGVFGADWGHGMDYGGKPCFREPYQVLWDSINADRGFPWGSNPWVWAITFKKL